MVWSRYRVGIRVFIKNQIEIIEIVKFIKNNMLTLSHTIPIAYYFVNFLLKYGC